MGQVARSLVVVGMGPVLALLLTFVKAVSMVPFGTEPIVRVKGDLSPCLGTLLQLAHHKKLCYDTLDQ